ncbi:MAG: hypothetical protein IT458_20605 [Planctomycetes bacterium]|nr:hypothetical protein [Planctomycetota bacterium]
MTTNSPSRSRRRPLWILAALCAWLTLGCLSQGVGSGAVHRWWAGLGPVLPHDTFPADCKLCHVGPTWNVLVKDFRFDHERETGYRLEGAHDQAQCLRCHNDRGPVAMFAARGCAGCHEDVHLGELGQDCRVCHGQHTWSAEGQVEMHDKTRFPLTGAHLNVGCHRCHPGAFVGRFYQTDTQCVTCHYDDMLRTTNPPHVGLGWTDNCDRCHVTTSWNHARIR